MGDVAWPRELVRASAGTGKTFRISSRIVALLRQGVEPDRILASTFTRKAAGEVLDRVLSRLARAALDADEAERLSGHAALPGAPGSDRGELGRGDAVRLLERLIRDLHRIDVGTLDALFVRMARSFSLELGLPPGWTIADEPTRQRLRSDAVQGVLRGEDHELLVELLRMLAQGEAHRRVHDRLVQDVDALHRLHRETEPGAPHPWSPFRDRDRTAADARQAARAELAARLEAAEPPRNKDGSPDRRWAAALEEAAGCLREGTWEEFWRTGPQKAWLQGEAAYYRKAFPAAVVEALEEARELAASALGAAYDTQARAMGRIARLYDEALAVRQRDEGAYRFGDVAHLLGHPDPVGGRRDLPHRLDRRTRHVLLDEFQDTSLPQWEALRPLVDAVSAEGGTAGTTVVVADPKQSIYGWRGADPAIVDRVGGRYGLAGKRLDVSWRSSPVVLEFVNRLFGDLASNPVLQMLERGPDAAERWCRAFDEHRPAPPHRGRPGHVCLEAGPDDGRDPERPRLMARAAGKVASLHAAAPGAEIGVLTQRNRTAARLIHELRQRGVEASEEGGTPVDDAAPVAAILALLRLADHPAHGVARYHVARSPLGEAVGLSDPRDDGRARELAVDVRRRLLRDGYGPTLSAWARRLAPDVTGTEFRRLEQLVELGFRWEERAGLRPSDFVRFVESEKVEDPLSAAVRVMTVHSAKGLEFDVVVMPELDRTLAAGGREVAVPERDPETGRVRRVFPAVPGHLRPLFPEMETALRQQQLADLRDDLSWLYVGVTRARYAAHLLMAADEGPRRSRARSFARLIRAAFGRHDEPLAEGERVLELGDPGWHEEVDGMGATGPSPAEEDLRLRVDPSAPRSRILARRTPSELEGGEEVDLARILRLETAEAFRQGDVVHAWCRQIEWLEDGLPPADELRRRGREAAPEMPPSEIDRLLRRFRRWLEAPPIRRALSREGTGQRAAEALGERLHRAEVELEVLNERSFAYRGPDHVLSGAVDRLVLVRVAEDNRAAGGRGSVLGAEVLDFKTDDVPPGDAEALDDRAAHYRPQLRAYRRAVAATYRLEPGAVGARLAFLRAGVVVEP